MRKFLIRLSFLKKILALSLVVMGLSLRLGSLTEEVFIKPVEDALFHKVFLAADHLFEGKLIKAKPNSLVSEIPGDPPESKMPVVEDSVEPETQFVSHLPLRDILSEIFIPPETLS